MLDLSQYRGLIELDEPFSSFAPRYTEEDVRKLEDTLLVQTAHLRAQGTVQNAPLSARDQLYTRLISRQPFSLSDGILQQIDRLLVDKTTQELPPGGDPKCPNCGSPLLPQYSKAWLVNLLKNIRSRSVKRLFSASSTNMPAPPRAKWLMY